MILLLPLRIRLRYTFILLLYTVLYTILIWHKAYCESNKALLSHNIQIFWFRRKIRDVHGSAQSVVIIYTFTYNIYYILVYILCIRAGIYSRFTTEESFKA